MTGNLYCIKRLLIFGGIMKHLSLAPCGVVCELCIGYQRSKNKCDGCNANGIKPKRCISCSIRNCKEKSNPEELCINCKKFPCRRLKDLEKRYSTKYNESPTKNMQLVENIGYEALEKEILKKWTCPECGKLLSAHRKYCVVCGHLNYNFPIEEN
jgi:hypothetical protein